MQLSVIVKFREMTKLSTVVLGGGDMIVIFNMLSDVAEVKVQLSRDEEKRNAVRNLLSAECIVLLRNVEPVAQN